MKAKIRSRVLAILMSLAMAFTMIHVMGTAAYADETTQNLGEITLSGDVKDLQDQTITFKRMLNGVIDPSKILKTNFTNGDYTWAIGKKDPASQTVTLSRNGTESSEFHDLTKNDAVKITCNYDTSETLWFSVTGDDFGRDINIYTKGETVSPSLGDDETVTLKVGENRTIADLAQVLDDDGNSYILHEYNYQVSDYNRSIASIKKITKDGTTAKDDDYITALNVTGEQVGQTVVEVTLCNNDRVPIEVPDQIPPFITKKYTINVVKDGEPDPPAPKPTKVIGTPLVRITTKGDNSLVVSWNKIQGVDGYDVYFAYCGETSKYAATVKGNKTFSWTKSGLKKGRCYKAYIKAYVLRNGKKVFVKCSPLVHAYASGGSTIYTSAKAVKVEKASANLKAGKAFQIKPSIEKLNKNRYLMPKKFAPTFRYMSSNENVATVSSGGKVTAKGKGTCNIYVYAHNGVSKQVKVTVK